MTDQYESVYAFNWDDAGGDYNGHLTDDQQLARASEWARWVETNKPLTKAQYKKMSKAERFQMFGHDPIMFHHFGGLVTCDGRAHDAFRAIVHKYSDMAHEVSKADRLDNGWDVDQHGWTAPDGRRTATNGLKWGSFASRDAHKHDHRFGKE